MERKVAVSIKMAISGGSRLEESIGLHLASLEDPRVRTSGTRPIPYILYAVFDFAGRPLWKRSCLLW